MNLAETFPIIKQYLDLGINLIPVRDRASTYQGKTYDVKTPYSGWKKYQTQKLSESQLYFEMEHNKTAWAAFVLGKISNNLFNIDIDCKYYPGFEALYFKDIKDLFPELWNKLRIHKTPSGGYHILYFMELQPPNSAKLASRLPTQEEQIAYKTKNPNAKSELKSVCFLETRGQGSLSTAIGDGYSIYINNPIPTLTDLEHEALINLGQSYNQIIKVEKPYTVSKFVGDYFDENPFDHFNNSNEGEMVLENNGWLPSGHNNKFKWYSRPESKSKAVHASFNFEKRCFYIFTSSTNFEPEKGYNPSTALSILQFGGDKKATFAHLQSSGFGKVNKYKELQVVKQLVKTDKPLPVNFSIDAKIALEADRITFNSTYPFGTFWSYDEDSKLTISREALYQVATKLGFRIYNEDLKLINGKILEPANERSFQDTLKSYINETDLDEQESVINTYEAFMQKNGKYTLSRLDIIFKEQILLDTKDTCYKFFNNGVVKITAYSLNAIGYEDLPKDKFILKSKIQPRDYNAYQGGLYEDYINLATDPNNRDHVQKCIGYLAHEYKDETTGYIIVLTEQCANPKDGGGSGKNVFCNLLSHTTTYHSKNGDQAKFDEKFFQSWSGQKLMAISDVPESFKFAFLKEPSTGTFIQKKLFKDEFEVSVEDGPKFIVQTNFSFKITDGGLRRRIINIEFTDFFTRAGGLDSHFGVHFPKGWTDKDWHGFDTYIIESVQKWLKSGCKLNRVELTQTGWEKQFEFTFGKHMKNIIHEFLPKWRDLDKIKTKDLKNDITNYLNENNVPKMYWPSSEKQNESISAYCEHHKIGLKVNIVAKDELNISCKYFKFEGLL